jgi:hypothetical protein
MGTTVDWKTDVNINKHSILNRIAGYCALHNKGPLDVWYDCDGCLSRSKESALKFWRPMPIAMILQLVSEEERNHWLRWANL